MMGTITIKGLRLLGHHGVLEQERRVGNMFEVDIEINVPGCQRAMQTDDIDDTINYADVIDLTKQEMSKPSKLIEAVAWRIGQAIQARYGDLIESGTICVKKLAPPVSAELDYVAFTYIW